MQHDCHDSGGRGLRHGFSSDLVIQHLFETVQVCSDVFVGQCLSSIMVFKEQDRPLLLFAKDLAVATSLFAISC